MRSACWTTKATGNTQWEYVIRTPIAFPRPQWLPKAPQYYVHTSCSSWERRGRLVSSRSTQRSDIEPGSVHAGFVVDNVARGHTLLLVLRLSPVRVIPSMLHLIFIFAVTLNKRSNGRTLQALQRKWQSSFGNKLFREQGRKIIMLLSIPGVTAVSVTPQHDIERDEINVN